MEIRTRMCISIDGCVTTSDGRPVQLADPTFSPQNYGFDVFQKQCDAVLMGRTTFEPAIGAQRWPWPDLDVFVLGSHRPSGTPDFVVVESDPRVLLEKIRAANHGKDVHLVRGPRTIETFRSIGALDKLGLLVLPLLIGDGMRLTPTLGGDASLTLESERTLANGVVELVYGVS